MSSHELGSVVSVDFPVIILTSPLLISLLPLFSQTPRVQPGGWLWISASASISYWMVLLIQLVQAVSVSKKLLVLYQVFFFWATNKLPNHEKETKLIMITWS